MLKFRTCIAILCYAVNKLYCDLLIHVFFISLVCLSIILERLCRAGPGGSEKEWVTLSLIPFLLVTCSNNRLENTLTK